jgi:hypothetical protein
MTRSLNVASSKLFSCATLLPLSYAHTAVNTTSNSRVIPLLLGLSLRATLCTVSVRFFAWYLRFRGVLQELFDGICMTGSPQRPDLGEYTPSSFHRDTVRSSFCIAESGLLTVDESPGGRVSDASVRAFSSKLISILQYLSQYNHVSIPSICRI